MGFSNGYDSGYADAIDDVRSGKVAGLGPTSGGSGNGAAPAPTYMTDAADRYVMVIGGSTRVRYAAPEIMTAVMNGTTLDLQASTDVPAGTVMKVNLSFEAKDPELADSDWGSGDGLSVGVAEITVNGAVLPDMPSFEGRTGLDGLILWYDGASWVYMSDIIL